MDFFTFVAEHPFMAIVLGMFVILVLILGFNFCEMCLRFFGGIIKLIRQKD